MSSRHVYDDIIITPVAKIPVIIVHVAINDEWRREQ